MPNCRPGDACIIVAEYPGSECNIGAYLTVKERDPEGDWLFVDASRPLHMVPDDPADGISWVTDSYSSPGAEDFWYVMPDRFLVPIRPVAEGDEIVTNITTDSPVTA
jgi:hypothetical protein